MESIEFNSILSKLTKPAIYHVYEQGQTYNAEKKYAKKEMNTYDVLNIERLKYVNLSHQISEMFSVAEKEINRILEESTIIMKDGETLKNQKLSNLILDYLKIENAKYPNIKSTINGGGRGMWTAPNGDIDGISSFHPQRDELIESYNRKQKKENEEVESAAHALARNKEAASNGTKKYKVGISYQEL